mgnify:CR=1 FL=1
MTVDTDKILKILKNEGLTIEQKADRLTAREKAAMVRIEKERKTVRIVKFASITILVWRLLK